MNVRAFSLLCVVTLFASLGADAPKEEKKKERSPYAGTYTGTFTASNSQGDQEGECTMTVAEDGKVTGEALNKTDNTTVKIKGTNLKDNKIVLVYEFSNGNKANAYGTVSKTADGGVTGTLIERFGTSAQVFVEFELKPKK
jgi:hypothetical protein